MVNHETLLPAMSQHYAPYGEPLDTASTTTSFGFTGEPTDANGLVHLRARYYDPALGVFPSLDPVEFVNRYRYVNNNPINITDPTGMIPFCVLAFATPVPFDDVGCIGILTGLILAGTYSLSQLQQDLESVGVPTREVADIIAEAERIVEEAIGRDTDPEPEPDPLPERRPWPIPIPFPRPDDDDESCPTNYPPGSSERFDTSREMEDLMCNIRRYTAPIGPQPNSWWNSLQGRVNPIFGNAWIGTVGAFLGRNPLTYTEFNTRPPNKVTGVAGDMFLPRPGFLDRTRADVMSIVIHELRHAGQYFSIFSEDTIRGQSLNCGNISGRIGEVDALLNENSWLVNSFQANLISATDIIDSAEPFNGGRMFTEDELWNHPYVLRYQQPYGNRFDNPPVFICPNSSASIGGC